MSGGGETERVERAVAFLREKHPNLLSEYFHMLLKVGDAGRAYREVFERDGAPRDGDWVEFARGLK